MDSCVKWLCQMLVRENGAKLEKDLVWLKYKEYCNARGLPSDSVSRKSFGDFIATFHPYIKLSSFKSKTAQGISKRTYCYMNIALAPVQEDVELSTEEIRSLLLKNNVSLVSREYEVSFGLVTDVICDGSTVMKEIDVDLRQCTWNMRVRGKKVNLENLGISQKFTNTISDISQMLFVMKFLKVCTGVSANNSDTNAYSVRETNMIAGDENSECTIIRSRYCQQVTSLEQRSRTCSTCCKCSRNSTNVVKDCEKEKELGMTYDLQLDEVDDIDMRQILESLVPEAATELKTMLVNQLEAINCSDPRQRRWSAPVISLCLSLWVKSRRAYETMRNSKMLVMPSGRTLKRHKSKVPSTSGFHTKTLRWMRQCSTKAGIPKDGMHGGPEAPSTKNTGKGKGRGKSSSRGRKTKAKNTSAKEQKPQQVQTHESSQDDIETSESALSVRNEMGENKITHEPRKRGSYEPPEKTSTSARKSQRLSSKKKTVILAPCGICQEECDTDSVQCDDCEVWHHYLCVGLQDGCAELEINWFCDHCQ